MLTIVQIAETLSYKSENDASHADFMIGLIDEEHQTL